MITLKESILNKTSNHISDLKHRLGTFGMLYKICEFGIYSNAMNFVMDGNVDTDKLDKLIAGKSYMHADNTSSMRKMNNLLQSSSHPFMRDNRPNIEVVLKIIKWIENLPCMMFERPTDIEGFLVKEFKQIIKKKLKVRVTRIQDLIYVNVSYKSGGTELDLFHFEISEDSKENFMMESILGNTKSKVASAVKGIKDMDYLGGLYEPVEIHMGMKSNNGIGVLKLSKLQEQNRGKSVINGLKEDDVDDIRMFELVKYLENINLVELGFPNFDCDVEGHKYYDLVDAIGSKMIEDGIFNKPEIVRVIAYQGWKDKGQFDINIYRKKKGSGLCVTFRKKNI